MRCTYLCKPKLKSIRCLWLNWNPNGPRAACVRCKLRVSGGDLPLFGSLFWWIRHDLFEFGYGTDFDKWSSVQVVSEARCACAVWWGRVANRVEVKGARRVWGKWVLCFGLNGGLFLVSAFSEEIRIIILRFAISYTSRENPAHKTQKFKLICWLAKEIYAF